MKLQFYPLDFEYKVKDGKVLVYNYGTLADGSAVCVIIEHQPFFYALPNNVDVARFRERLQHVVVEDAKIVSWEEGIEKELLGKKRSFWKIFVNFPKAVPLLSKQLEEWGISTYEKDILFVHRYLRDLDIIPMTLVEAEGEFVNESMRVPVFRAVKIIQANLEIASHLKMLAVDIETYAERKDINPHKYPILMIGFYGKNKQGEFRKVITWKKFNHDLEYVEHVADEKKMLERFKEVILTFQPDILTGYFSDGFDFPYLKIRAEKYGLPLDFGHDYSELIAGTKADFRDGEAKIRGIMHLDVLKFIRNIFGKDLETDSYTLDAVAEELLGHRKHVVDLDQLPQAWNQASEKLAQFCSYNLHDAYLTQQLCEKLLPDMIVFSTLTGLPLFDVIRMRFSRLVESYILKKAAECNVVAPNKPASFEMDQRQEESYEGGFVFEPQPGLYQDIVVFDFRSLYPTIITAHNISPESLQTENCQKKVEIPGFPEYWFCQDTKSFLPTILEELILRRAELKKQIKEAKKSGQDTKMVEARSYALKILANSFYGYLGFFGARWYSVESARSTTALARDYIKKTISKAEERGFKVVYGDTDSCFFLLGRQSLEAAQAFMEEINETLPGYMELEFEGFYPRGIFVATKTGEKGAKKKYALRSESGALKITGFETVRRNWSSIAKEVQKQVLKLVLQDQVEDAVKYAKGVAQDLKAGRIPLSQLIIKTQITRELGNYAAQGPHVAIAQKLQAKGEQVLPGTVVEYVIGKGAGIIRERAKLLSELKEGDYDADYYLNHQIIPAVSSIFAVLGYKEDEIFQESSQVGLGKFF